MSATRLDTDSINLLSEFTVWPFVDNVDQDPSFAFPGSGKCGNIVYSVLDANLQPSTFVYYDGLNRIVMEPTLSEPITNGMH